MTVILSVLALAVPVHCYSSETVWERELQERAVPYMALAFYVPGSRIVVGPDGCREILKPSLLGANLLAHELAHHWQHMNGRSFDEGEADRIANWADEGVLRRLVRVLGRKARVVPSFWVVLGR
jgi:hypothetical protein